MAETNYLWDEIEDNVIEEFDGVGNTSVSYTTEPTRFSSVLTQDRGGEVRHYHYDGQSNAVSLTDDGGNVTDTRKYSAFGKVTESTGTTELPYQWKGQIQQSPLSTDGPYYARIRFFLPAVGRWASLTSPPNAKCRRAGMTHKLGNSDVEREHITSSVLSQNDGESKNSYRYNNNNPNALSSADDDDNGANPDPAGGNNAPPPGSEKWTTCKPKRPDPGHNAGADANTCDLWLDTCCSIKVTFRLLARRCFEPGWEDEHGAPDVLAKHFFVELILKTDYIRLTGICPPRPERPSETVLCQIFPGRFISRLRGVTFDNYDWPKCDIMMDTIEAIRKNACQAVIDTPPGVP